MNKYFLQNVWKTRLFLGLIASSLIVTSTNSVFAQIVPDKTLGRENSLLNPNANVRGLPATLLQGGAIRGVNLFQSFLKFNVGDGQRVYFSNPAGIQNILSRITGGDPSKIFGTLGVDGKANLFFLNPNGIIFGPNAKLDVAGSFFASTANSFVFENGLQFSATNPEVAPLITVNIRPGLQFGSDRSGNISSTANLNAGEDLTLSGVNLDLQGKLEAGRDLTLQATDAVKIRDRVANPFIASAGGKLVVQGNQNVDIFALNNPNSGFFSGGDILLRSANTIGGDAHYWAGGNFRIEQLDGNLGNLFSPDDPVIRASGDVSFGNYTGASLHILAGGSVTIGTVDIKGADPTNGLLEEVKLSDGTPLQINGATQATLDIRAGTTAFGTPGLVPVNFPGTGNVINPNPPTVGSVISNQTQTAGAKITIGGINVAPGGQVFLTNQYQPNTSIPGGLIEITGVAPNSPVNDAYSIRAIASPVTIDSRGSVRVAEGINTSISTGRGGDINILGVGDIDILKGNNVFQAGLTSGVNNNQNTNPNDEAGNITLISTNGKIQTLGKIDAFSSIGNGGNITLHAKDKITIADEIASRILKGPGKAGSIQIISDTGDIISDTGDINKDTSALRQITSSTPNGQGGNITLNVPQGQIIATGWTINSKSENGLAGNIALEASGDISLGNVEASSNNNNGGDFSKITIQSNKGSVFLDNSRLSTSNSGSASAGDISITAVNTVSILNSNYDETTPEQEKKGILSEGNFGRIFIGASNNVENANYTSLRPKIIEINNSRLSTTNVVGNTIPVPDEKINAGDISIRAIDQISLDGNSQLDTETSRKGNAGNVLLESNNGNISLGNTIIFSNVASGAVGKAGDVSIATNGGAVALDGKDGTTQIQVQTQGTGDAGNVSIATNGGAVSLDNGAIVFSSVEPGATGNAGKIDIEKAGSVSLRNGAELQTLVRNQTRPDNEIRNAGDITIKADGAVTLDGVGSAIFSSLGSGTSGQAGNIDIKANSISLDHRAKLDNITLGNGHAGNVLIATNGGVVSLDNGAKFDNRTFGNGNAGNVSIATNGGAVSLDHVATIFSSVEPEARGNAGKIDITAGSVSLKNGAELQTLVRDRITPDNEIRNAGDITIRADGAVNIDGAISSIFSKLGSGTSGKAGNIDIIANSISLDNRAKLDNSTLGNGDAGNVTIATNGGALSLDDGTILNSTFGNGNAGNVSIATNGGAVSLDNGATIFSSVEPGAIGHAGDISITANSVSVANGSTLDNSTSGNGYAGKVNITANNFEALNGSQVRTNTATNGNAGKIELKIKDNITLSGAITSTNPESDRQSYYLDENNLIPSGLFATTEQGSTGAGGSISIDPNIVTIKDGARIAVDSKGSGNAGTITLNANRLTLDNQGKITADTSSGTGGDITLKLRDLLLMRRNSLISATAGDSVAGGNGGNITITSLDNSKPFPFIVAVNGENSDIIANAKTGAGGRININTSGLFGIAPLSRKQLGNNLPGNLPSNDITAISQQGSPALDGQVNINSPDVDLTNDLVTLPENPVDASKLIAQGCGTFAAKRSEFINAGRGGLPPSPDGFSSSDALWNDTRLTMIPTNQQIPNAGTVSPDKSALAPIIPATGWVFNGKGDVTLVSYTSGANSLLFNSNSSNCRIP